MSIRIHFSDFQKAITAGIHTAEYSFTSNLVAQWLAKYPNDIQAEILKARVLLNRQENNSAKRILESVFNKDPENIACLNLLHKNSVDRNKFYASAIYMLTGEAAEINAIFPWATTVRAIRREISKKNYQHAEVLLRRSISESPDNIFVALEHANLISITKDLKTAERILKIYTKRWPECIKFKLFQVLILVNSHQESEAVSLLHTCLRLDPSGTATRRLFGSYHEFLSIYPNSQFIVFSDEIPTSISISFDWTQLDSGAGPVGKSTAEIQSEKRYKNIQSMEIDSSEPHSQEKVYVILTSFIGLKSKYGPRTTDVIINNLKKLSTAVEMNPRWKPFLFVPDSNEHVKNIGLKPISEIDPWKIKLALMDLNATFKKSNQEIGAVLIVGNHDVVPFHRLPNPTEDSDMYVLSDNPYATSSSNYMLPEWVVGRLPGEKGNDPGLLLELIRHIIQFHSDAHDSKGLIHKFNQFVRRLKNIGRFLRELFNPPNDFGFSAEVWRRSSIAAFRPIGKGADLRVSPPYDADTIDIDKLLQAKCAYFNLHGLATTNAWYGQRDFGENPTGPDFPVAIDTKQIENIKNNIDLVFTEACYGGYIQDKKIDESIALKLLTIGSQGVVGSSCISYGSVFTPLIGADLLAFIFWKYIKDGYAFGSALRQAKIGLIKVMMQRQGYLDGEDQKTLLSFNLYGDPLGCLEEIVYLEKNGGAGFEEVDLPLMRDADGIIENNYSQNQILSKDVNEMLESYLPGLESATMRVRKQKIQLAKTLYEDPAEKLGTNLDPQKITQIVYEKTISVNRLDHTQIARVTLDAQGKVIKLAMSR